MPDSRIYKLIVIFAILFSLDVSISGTFVFAYDDGFGSAEKLEGKHFAVYYSPQIDLSNLAQQLNLGVSDRILVGGSMEKGFPSGRAFTNMLDDLFMRACDILDMHLYSFNGNIKICVTQEQLNAIYNNLFGKYLASYAHSFYVYDLNTIYASAENFKMGVIGHEIAHAIISHYFVVQPPVKIQEVLAGYVEYQLRKIEQ
jgi:hypothetical protein